LEGFGKSFLANFDLEAFSKMILEAETSTDVCTERNKPMNLLPTHKGNPNMRKGAPSVNPAGRPLGARQKIAEKLLADLAEVWEAAGKQVLARLANDDPAKLATIAFGLLPRDVFVQVAQAAPGGLNAEEWSQLRGVLDAIEAARLGDVEPSEIFAGISTYLRSEFAKTIEHQAEPEPIAATIPAPPF
jgi:hypothetical protein